MSAARCWWSARPRGSARRSGGWWLVAGGAARARGDRGRPQPRRRRGAGRRAGRTVIAADVAQEAEFAALFAQIGETPLAGAVNNAAMTQDALQVDEIPLDLFARVFALNVRGLLLCLAREIAAMRGADETKGAGRSSTLPRSLASAGLPV